ncbi:hypothetical protein DPMN_126712 [Dreissena polymorpha]|uniref:Transmembrane protein n=1 Tax=Dreissena polymorpha TaxID=45954 RepID=A0A9D4GXL8_DREPO|nr:hypothetical protein DPMN_126712 [Dreissena polymorpha]
MFCPREVQDQVFVRNSDIGGGCVSYYWLEQLLRFAHEKCKTKYLFEIMMLVVMNNFEIMMLTKYLLEIMMLVVVFVIMMLVVSSLCLEQLICMALLVCNNDVGGGGLICFALFVRNNDVGGGTMNNFEIMMLVVVYKFEIMMLVVSYLWLDQLICIALFVRNNDVGGGRVLYNWFEQLIPIALEKCKTKYLLEIMMLVAMNNFEIMMLYKFEIMMLVVSYLWLDQLICIALFVRNNDVGDVLV